MKFSYPRIRESLIEIDTGEPAKSHSDAKLCDAQRLSSRSSSNGRGLLEPLRSEQERWGGGGEKSGNYVSQMREYETLGFQPHAVRSTCSFPCISPRLCDRRSPLTGERAHLSPPLGPSQPR